MSGVGKITMKLSVTHKLKYSFCGQWQKKGFPGASVMFCSIGMIFCLVLAQVVYVIGSATASSSLVGFSPLHGNHGRG